jgi:hypothetical protein
MSPGTGGRRVELNMLKLRDRERCLARCSKPEDGAGKMGVDLDQGPDASDQHGCTSNRTYRLRSQVSLRPAIHFSITVATKLMLNPGAHRLGAMR